MTRLRQVSDHVLVATADFAATNTIVVLGEDREALVVDPGVSPAELDALAAELAWHGRQVVVGVATHPHWDHVLWHRSWLGAPRWAAARCVADVEADRAGLLAQARAQTPVDEALFGAVVALADTAEQIPWSGPRVRLIRHAAHVPGSLALHVVDDAVLVAGDLLSDLEIPLLDGTAADPLGDYLQALERLDALAIATGGYAVVPGHGRVAGRVEAARRLTADRHYLHELARGAGDDDPRLAAPGPAGADLRRSHRDQRRQVRS